MTEYIPQTSASARIEAAREALDYYDTLGATDDPTGRIGYEYDRQAHVAIRALRALITPPSVGESEEKIARRIKGEFPPRGVAFAGGDYGRRQFFASYERALLAAVRAGIQSAHESWECEVALRPSQEQMLRWLGIECDETDGEIFIPDQHIEREEI